MLSESGALGKAEVVAEMVALKKARGNAVLKFEPLVLHVQCQQLQDAQLLHSVAVDSGFRNSGITVGKKGKTMLAVRSTHGLEVPLSNQGKLMVTEEYIDFLLNIANQKMEENKKRIESFVMNNGKMIEMIDDSKSDCDGPQVGPKGEASSEMVGHVATNKGHQCHHSGKSPAVKQYASDALAPVEVCSSWPAYAIWLCSSAAPVKPFYNCLQHALERETITNSHPKIKEKNNPSCSPKKERNPAKAHGKCTLEENDKEIENDDDDDPGLGVAVFPEDY
ncbi:tRNA wybutosine-synthesizing protein 3-like protein [Heterocephalus glaber]|uniref:tRNA wybutosine-synthesizing protein 3 homolog n=1 Tax=Heterocephalus glaber TaxID=10181 RepID=G5AQ89_HETGA|nr:tRNA wybutosine-synthesizing protein 3-like protein [Heterocephalus glaber]